MVEENNNVHWTPADMLERRNTITTLLSDWGLIKLAVASQLDCAPLRQIKIIPFKEKNEWELCPKYNIGNK